jgi:hypothetical protein
MDILPRLVRILIQFPASPEVDHGTFAGRNKQDLLGTYPAFCANTSDLRRVFTRPHMFGAKTIADQAGGNVSHEVEP